MLIDIAGTSHEVTPQTGLVVACTGHRPAMLGGYSKHIFDSLITVARSVIAELKPKKIITGMALGWDMAFACAAFHERVPYVAAIPCAGQERFWRQEHITLYQMLLDSAAEKVTVSKAYTHAAMQRRNVWMVDHCECLVALWNGSSGGTANCMKYAESKTLAKPVILNVWPMWRRYLGL